MDSSRRVQAMGMMNSEPLARRSCKIPDDAGAHAISLGKSHFAAICRSVLASGRNEAVHHTKSGSSHVTSDEHM